MISHTQPTKQQPEMFRFAQHDRKNNEWRREARNSYSALNASPAASPVRSISASVCAVEMKPVSNCDGAKYTPRFKQA
jgi:hypothetical protein